MIFDRIIDIHNFEFINMLLNAEEQAAVYARIGILNIFNPCKPEGAFKELMFDRGFAPNPGWDLSVVWFTEEGLPKKGVLTVDIFAGDGMNMNGGQVDRTLRSALCSLVLAGERDLAVEVAAITDRNDDLTSKYAVYRRLQSSDEESGKDRSLRKSMAEHQSAMVLAVYSNSNKATTSTSLSTPPATPDIASSGGGVLGTRKFVMEDANRLLRQTDLQWNYYSNSKSYSWQSSLNELPSNTFSCSSYEYPEAYCPPGLSVTHSWTQTEIATTVALPSEVGERDSLYATLNFDCSGDWSLASSPANVIVVPAA
eukprot:gene30051-39243_t